jgi:cell division protein FtsA
MLKRAERNLIVGLDIGTSKVVSLVGEVGLDGSIELLGVGSQPSRGLKKGVVVNIESTVQSIQRAVEEAELMAGCEIHSVFAGIAGSHVRSLNSHGVVGVRDREVSHGDVEHVIDAAKAVAIPADQKILHVLPQEFIVDGQEGIRDPIGMSGVRTSMTWCSSSSPPASRSSPRMRRSSACAWSTSAVAPPISRCLPTAPSATPP